MAFLLVGLCILFASICFVIIVSGLVQIGNCSWMQLVHKSCNNDSNFGAPGFQHVLLDLQSLAFKVAFSQPKRWNVSQVDWDVMNLSPFMVKNIVEKFFFQKCYKVRRNSSCDQHVLASSSRLPLHSYSIVWACISIIPLKLFSLEIFCTRDRLSYLIEVSDDISKWFLLFWVNNWVVGDSEVLHFIKAKWWYWFKLCE